MEEGADLGLCRAKISYKVRIVLEEDEGGCSAVADGGGGGGGDGADREKKKTGLAHLHRRVGRLASCQAHHSLTRRITC